MEGMKQDPACTWSLWGLTAASSPARGEEQGETWSFWNLSLWSPQLEPEPLRMQWQSCQLVFFTLFLKEEEEG